MSSPPRAGPKVAPTVPAVAQMAIPRFVRACEAGEERQRTGQHQGSAEALHRPGGDEHREAVCEAARDRGGQEHDQAGEHERRRSQSPHEREQRERRDEDHEVVRGDDPRDPDDRGVQVDVQLRQREHDDRRVGEGDRDGDGQGDLERAGPVHPGQPAASVRSRKPPWYS